MGKKSAKDQAAVSGDKKCAGDINRMTHRLRATQSGQSRVTTRHPTRDALPVVLWSSAKEIDVVWKNLLSKYKGVGKSGRCKSGKLLDVYKSGMVMT